MGEAMTTEPGAAQEARSATAPPGKARRSAVAAKGTDDAPERALWRIGEVAEKLGVPTHVIRFWQTQFPALQPARTGTGRFIYTSAQVDQLLRIRQLLHVERMTIAGAKRALRSGKARVLLASSAAAAQDEFAAERREVAAALGEVEASAPEARRAPNQATPAVDPERLESLRGRAQALRRSLEAMRVQIEEA